MDKILEKKVIQIRRIFFIFLGLIIFVFQITEISAKVLINDVKIVDDNSVDILFNELPVEYQSELSDEKLKVFLDIPFSDFNEQCKERHSDGNIKDVFLQRQKDKVRIILNTIEKTGYTAISLPYSKSILIEIFQWTGLSTPDENLRSGLLALEDGLYEPGKKFLGLSAESGNSNASTHLGILNLYEGKLKTAFKYFLFAQSQNSLIPDTYAALAQVFKQFDMTNEYEAYSKKFKELTGFDEFPMIVIGEIPADDSLDKGTIESLLKVYPPLNEKQQLNDTMNSKFKKVLSSYKEDVEQKSFLNSLFPDWFIEYMMYIFIAFIATIFFIYFSFRKWKVKQIEANKDKYISLKPEFNDVMKSASDNITRGSNVANIYKANEQTTILSDSGDEKAQEKIKSTPKIADNKKTQKGKTAEIHKTESKAEEPFGEKIDRLAKQLIAAQQKQSLEEYEQELEDLQNQKKDGLDAKAKLAMHLQERDFEMKQKSLMEMDKIPDDDKKIKDISKTMKVEKAVLEAKKDLTKLTENKKSFQELKNKFNNTENEPKNENENLMNSNND